MKTAFDTACAERAAVDKELDEREFDECDAEPVPVDADLTEDSDNDVDFVDMEESDDIDFSAYGVNEADMREPLTAAAEALGKPASSANLVAQNTVKLNENADSNEVTSVDLIPGFIKKYVTRFGTGEIQLAAMVKEGRFNPAVVEFKNGTLTLGPGDQDMWLDYMIEQLKHEGCSKMSQVKDIVFKDKAGNIRKFKSFSPLGGRWTPRDCDVVLVFFFEDLNMDDTNGFFDECDEPSKKDELIKEAEDGVEKLKAAADELPITDDDWKEIDALPDVQSKIDAINAKCEGVELSAKAREELDATIELVRSMADFERNEKEMNDAFQRAKQLQKKTIERDLTANELEELRACIAKLDDDRKDLLLSIRNSGPLRTRVFLSPHDIEYFNNPNYSSGSYSKKGGDDDDEDNTGDERREMRKVSDFFLRHPELEYIPEPMSAGWYDRLFGDVPGFVSAIKRRREERAEIDKAAAASKEMLPKLNALLRYYDAHDAIRSKEFQDAWRDPNGSTLGKTWDKVVQGLKTTQNTDQLKKDLQAAVANEPDSRSLQMMIEYMFNGMKFTSQMNGMIKGAGSDQKGKTGMMTQRGDTDVYALLVMMANQLNVAMDEADELREKMRRQAPNAADKAAGLEPRKRCKDLAQIVLQDILDEITAGRSRVTVPHPADDKKTFTNLAGMALVLVWRDATPAERSEMQRWWKEDFEEKHAVRKHMTHLTREQNSEFQQIIQNSREGTAAGLDLDKKVRVLQLDIMRRSVGNETNPAIEQQALNKVQRALEYAQSHHQMDQFDKRVQNAITSFLAGESPNNAADAQGV